MIMLLNIFLSWLARLNSKMGTSYSLRVIKVRCPTTTDSKYVSYWPSESNMFEETHILSAVIVSDSFLMYPSSFSSMAWPISWLYSWLSTSCSIKYAMKWVIWVWSLRDESDSFFEMKMLRWSARTSLYFFNSLKGMTTKRLSSGIYSTIGWERQSCSRKSSVWRNFLAFLEKNYVDTIL